MFVDVPETWKVSGSLWQHLGVSKSGCCPCQVIRTGSGAVGVAPLWKGQCIWTALWTLVVCRVVVLQRSEKEVASYLYRMLKIATDVTSLPSWYLLLSSDFLSSLSLCFVFLFFFLVYSLLSCFPSFTDNCTLYSMHFVLQRYSSENSSKELARNPTLRCKVR